MTTYFRTGLNQGVDYTADLGDLFVPRAPFTEGGLWGWGLNSVGQLGSNNIIDTSSPIQTIAFGNNWKQVAIGTHTVAIKTDGTLWTWGFNSFGSLGTNDATNRSSPVQTVAFGTNWRQCAAGLFHTVAIKTDGTLWGWGLNQTGQLGINDTANRSSPIQTVAFGSNWKQVACGGYHTAAVKTDGTLWTWGRNLAGQLGDNSTIDKSSPIQVVSITQNWKQVGCGTEHTVAIKTNGQLWTVGLNTFGQLGDNSTNSNRSLFTNVTGDDWKFVATGGGSSSSAAIKNDGSLWGWGFWPNLGDNTSVNKSSPVQTIARGYNWKHVAVGSTHNIAVKTDGTLWVWGTNIEGQLGTGNNIGRSSPVQTVMFGTNWKSAAAADHSVALKDDL